MLELSTWILALSGHTDLTVENGITDLYNPFSQSSQISCLLLESILFYLILLNSYSFINTQIYFSLPSQFPCLLIKRHPNSLQTSSAIFSLSSLLLKSTHAILKAGPLPYLSTCSSFFLTDRIWSLARAVER